MKCARAAILACLSFGAAGTALAQPARTPAPPAAASAGGSKICSPYIVGGWRTMVEAPASWTVQDCRNVAATLGANMVQLGCAWARPPAGITAKFNLGREFSVDAATAEGAAPRPNCGW